ncbi:MAG: hypothetical protein WD066_18730 [Planctomycetaceae bacterium]
MQHRNIRLNSTDEDALPGMDTIPVFSDLRVVPSTGIIAFDRILCALRVFASTFESVVEVSGDLSPG